MALLVVAEGGDRGVQLPGVHLLIAVGVELRLARPGQGLGQQRVGSGAIAALGEQLRLDVVVGEVLVHRDRAVHPRHRAVEGDVVVQTVVGRLVPRLPEELRQPVQVLVQPGDRQGLRVHGDGERNPELLPGEDDADRVGSRILERVGERLDLRTGLRRRAHAQSVVLRVVAEAAPVGVHLGEREGPVALRGDHVQAVAAGGQWLPLDGDRRRERDPGVLVGAGAPDLVVGNERAPDLAPLDQGPAVVDRDPGDADRLRHRCGLADPRQRQRWPLGLGRGGGQERDDGEDGGNGSDEVTAKAGRAHGSSREADGRVVELLDVRSAAEEVLARGRSRVGPGRGPGGPSRPGRARADRDRVPPNHRKRKGAR